MGSGLRTPAVLMMDYVLAGFELGLILELCIFFPVAVLLHVVKKGLNRG